MLKAEVSKPYQPSNTSAKLCLSDLVSDELLLSQSSSRAARLSSFTARVSKAYAEVLSVWNLWRGTLERSFWATVTSAFPLIQNKNLPCVEPA